LNPGALNNTDEAYLIRCCKDNSPAAQKMLYNKYVDSIMILCMRYIPDREDAKEALMDSFFHFFNNINGFTYLGEGSVNAWLKKIALNQCLTRLRKKRPLFITEKEVAVFEDAPAAGNVHDEMNVREIMKLVHSLPDGYRTVFNLYVFEGMNHREIGELLGISDNTSKSQLYKAREILKKKILQTN
jgi:RNA polymerase sigma-70 factor, ECF subfamily